MDAAIPSSAWQALGAVAGQEARNEPDEQKEKDWQKWAMIPPITGHIHSTPMIWLAIILPWAVVITIAISVARSGW